MDGGGGGSLLLLLLLLLFAVQKRSEFCTRRFINDYEVFVENLFRIAP